MTKRAAIYVRVSTDKQTNRESASRIAPDCAAAWVGGCQEYRDAGISGSKGREERPGLDEMLKDAQRRRFDVVMAWAIDRLGRALSSIC